MTKLSRFTSGTILVFAMLASVAQAAPTITRVVGDLPARTLIITGNELPTNRSRAITLGGITLSVIARSPTRIVATLPASVGIGTYPLRIQDGPEIDVTLTGSVGSGAPGAGAASAQMFMGNTTDMSQAAGSNKWFSPVGRADEAARLAVGVMTPGPSIPVTVHSLRVKKFGFDGLSPAKGNIVVSVVAVRDNTDFGSALRCTIIAGDAQCTSVGSIDIRPGENFAVNVIHSANEDLATSLAWNFQVE